MRKWIIVLIIFFLNLLFIKVCVDWPGFSIDEGTVLSSAERVVNGEVTYKDYFLLWNFGLIFLYKLILLYIGKSLIWGRILTLLFFCLYAYVILIAANRLTLSKISSMFLSVSLIFFGFQHWNMPYPDWYALPLGVIAALFYEKKSFWLCGIFFGLSFFFKHNIAIGGLASLIFIEFFYEKKVKNSVKIIFPIALVFIMEALYFAKLNALSPFLKQLFEIPLLYRKTMPYAPDTNTFFNSFFLYAFPFAAWPIAFLAVIKDSIQKRKIQATQYLFIFAGLSIQMYPRYDHQHILFSYPLATFALCYSFDIFKNTINLKRIILFFLVGSSITGIYKTSKLIPSVINPTGSYLGIQAAGNTGHLLNETSQTIKYIKTRSNIQANETVLIFPHDTIFYFNNFKNPTGLLQFMPGFTEFYGENQSEVLLKFERSGGKYIILGLKDLFQNQTPILAEEFFKNYKQIKKFPARFSVWVKN